jgi:hypothetical protein
MGRFLNDPIKLTLFKGFFELTSGISSLGEVCLSQYWRFVIAAFILSFSGLCANMQAICFLKDAGLDIKPYLVGRGIMVMICTGLSFCVGFVL